MDISDVRMDISDVRMDISDVRMDISDVRMDISDVRTDMIEKGILFLKWNVLSTVDGINLKVSSSYTINGYSKFLMEKESGILHYCCHCALLWKSEYCLSNQHLVDSLYSFCRLF